MLAEMARDSCRLTPDEPLVFDFIRSAVNSVDRQKPDEGSVPVEEM